MGLIAGAATAPRAQETDSASQPLRERFSQSWVAGEPSLRAVRRAGLEVFSRPFDRHDGLGDGPMDPNDPVSAGGRPTLGGNGSFLRLNGLDSQTCLECHSLLSNASVPARFAVGGAGGVAASAFPGVVAPDVADALGNGFAAISGRMINPPFVFGAGGIELLAKEMTRELQVLREQARSRPGQPIELWAKGVHFGTLVFQNGGFVTSGVEGIDADLVVRPFGRKGCCATLREFDLNAFQFHHGIQPVEVVGNVDADGDGVANELLPGELSALHVYSAALEPPREDHRDTEAQEGMELFELIGCAGCHVPELVTERRELPLAFPEVPTDPDASVYRHVDLAAAPTRFPRARGGGVRVRLYSDLKRHDLGLGLAESTGDPLDPFFVTARLWGVADSAPYLHDGRATTLSDAILLHGGEAALARDAFAALSPAEQARVLAFLATLRTPRNPNADLVPR